jgi:cellulose biosynthesis protein BcsQ
MSKIISIINHIEQSGKTIISFNLSCALSVIGKKTLYLTYKSNSDFEKLSKNKITDDVKFQELDEFSYICSKTDIKGLDFFILDTSVIDIEDNKNSVLFLKKYLKSVYDYVIIDSQSSLIEDFDLFTALCDEYIIPIEPDSETFDHLAPMLAKIKWLKEENIEKPSFSGFLLNKVNNDSKLYNLFKKNAFFLFRSYVLNSLILNSPMLDFKINPSGCVLDNVLDKSFMCFVDLAELITKGENP